MKYLQLTWANWSEICEFIDSNSFIKGQMINNSKIGLLMMINNETILVEEDEFIIKYSEKYTICKTISDIRDFKIKYYLSI